jgi:hypothetical protein
MAVNGRPHRANVSGAHDLTAPSARPGKPWRGRLITPSLPGEGPLQPITFNPGPRKVRRYVPCRYADWLGCVKCLQLTLDERVA